MRTTTGLLMAVLGALTLTAPGCSTRATLSSRAVPSSPPAATAAAPAVRPYAGPIDVVPVHRGSLLRRGGSAAAALECRGTPYAAGSADYDSGLASTRGSAPAALTNLLRRDYLGEVPTDGYRVERDDGDRALLSYDVDGRTRVAFVAADGVDDWRGRTGWGVVAWAACDPSELPEAVSLALGIEVWTDPAGVPLPVTRVVSYPGPEHCGWQDATFLYVGGPQRGQQYVGDPTGELTDLLPTPYSGAAELPADATDAGIRRSGRELWLVPDRSAAYLVDEADAADVQRWPAPGRSIGCD